MENHRIIQQGRRVIPIADPALNEISQPIKTTQRAVDESTKNNASQSTSSSTKEVTSLPVYGKLTIPITVTSPTSFSSPSPTHSAEVSISHTITRSTSSPSSSSSFAPPPHQTSHLSPSIASTFSISLQASTTTSLVISLGITRSQSSSHTITSSTTTLPSINIIPDPLQQNLTFREPSNVQRSTGLFVPIIIGIVILLVAFLAIGVSIVRWRRQNENDTGNDGNFVSYEFGCDNYNEYLQELQLDKHISDKSLHCGSMTKWNPFSMTSTMGHGENGSPILSGNMNTCIITQKDPYDGAKYTTQPISKAFESNTSSIPLKSLNQDNDLELDDLSHSINGSIIRTDTNMDTLQRVSVTDESNKLPDQSTTNSSSLEDRTHRTALRNLERPALTGNPNRVVLPNSPVESVISMEKLGSNLIETESKKVWTLSRELMSPLACDQGISFKTYSWRSHVTDSVHPETNRGDQFPPAHNSVSSTLSRAKSNLKSKSFIHAGSCFIVKKSFVSSDVQGIESKTETSPVMYLHVQQGDPVYILQDLDNGWVMARTPDGQAGRIPKNVLIRW